MSKEQIRRDEMLQKVSDSINTIKVNHELSLDRKLELIVEIPELSQYLTTFYEDEDGFGSFSMETENDLHLRIKVLSIFKSSVLTAELSFREVWHNTTCQDAHDSIYRLYGSILNIASYSNLKSEKIVNNYVAHIINSQLRPFLYRWHYVFFENVEYAGQRRKTIPINASSKERKSFMDDVTTMQSRCERWILDLEENSISEMNASIKGYNRYGG